MIVAAEKQNSGVGSLLVALRAREEGLRQVVAELITMSRARITAKSVRSMVLPARAGLVRLVASTEPSSGGSSKGPGANLLSTGVESDAANAAVLVGALLSSVNETDAEMKAARNLAHNRATPRSRCRDEDLSQGRTMSRIAWIGIWSSVDPPTRAAQNVGKR
jgi:hypothetical protein